MRRNGLVIVLLLSLAGLGFGPPSVLDSSESAVPLHGSTVAAVQSLEHPLVDAEGWAILDQKTGRLLAGENAHQRFAPASTTKIATAMVALERGSLDDMVTVRIDSREMVDSSVMGLVPGQTLTLIDLLYGLLLPSGNDAALAIAEHIAGDEAAFVDMMNAKVREISLEDTNFENPHGLDAPMHYSTPYELAVLARHALRNPVFAEIVATREHALAGGRRLTNTNHLLYRYEGLDGVKTGYTENALQALVGSATRDGRQVITAVIRSHDRFGDTAGILDYAFGNYGWRTLDVPAWRVALGNGTTSTPDPPRQWPNVVALPKWQLPFVRSMSWLDESALIASGSPGRQVGAVGFYLGERLIAETSLHGR